MQQARQVAVVRSAVFWLASHRWVWVFLGRRAAQEKAMRQTLLLAVMGSGVFLQAVHRCERMLQTLLFVRQS